MKFLVEIQGFSLIFLGVLLFAALQLLHFTFVNFITFTPFAIMIMGGLASMYGSRNREALLTPPVLIIVLSRYF